MSDDRISKGQCLCGGVRFEAMGEPNCVVHCHCQSCRRNTGSVMATFVGFLKTNIEFSGRPRAFFESSPGVQRGFCDKCGTPMSFDAEWYGTDTHVYISALEDPDALPASGHVFYGEKISWFNPDDGLPKSSGSGDF